MFFIDLSSSKTDNTWVQIGKTSFSTHLPLAQPLYLLHEDNRLQAPLVGCNRRHYSRRKYCSSHCKSYSNFVCTCQLRFDEAFINKRIVAYSKNIVRRF